MEYERIYDEMDLSYQTAQIYEDCMYVYAKNHRQEADELWSFDLSMGGYFKEKY